MRAAWGGMLWNATALAETPTLLVGTTFHWITMHKALTCTWTMVRKTSKVPVCTAVCPESVSCLCVLATSNGVVNVAAICTRIEFHVEHNRIIRSDRAKGRCAKGTNM